MVFDMKKNDALSESQHYFYLASMIPRISQTVRGLNLFHFISPQHVEVVSPLVSSYESSNGTVFKTSMNCDVNNIQCGTLNRNLKDFIIIVFLSMLFWNIGRMLYIEIINRK